MCLNLDLVIFQSIFLASFATLKISKYLSLCELPPNDTRLYLVQYYFLFSFYCCFVMDDCAFFA